MYLYTFRPDTRTSGRSGAKRKIFVDLDPAQYYADIRMEVDCYERTNLVIRRSSKENNFKSVLESIRDLLNTLTVETAIPSWMKELLLGYGNPRSAHYRYCIVLLCTVCLYVCMYSK
jgi:intron-binding protein aquarius